MALREEFIEKLYSAIGKENGDIFLSQLNCGKESTSIRINPLKCNNAANLLEKLNIAGRVPWSSYGYYLLNRPIFTLDPLLHCGAYYVQEASSMYMEIVRESIESVENGFFNNSLRVLDLCAAPGGKSTHICSLLNSSSLLVSNEVINSRSAALAENMAKWGADNVIVTNSDPSNFKNLKAFFDLIIVDAPCSGEGLFRKNPSAIDEWSPNNVNLCAQRQRRIVSDIWNSLAEGGFLVYSTCTYNLEENDCNLDFIVNEFGAEVVELSLPVGAKLLRSLSGGVRFVPGLVEGEGQFMAVVRKCCGERRVEVSPTKKIKLPIERSIDFLPNNYVMLNCGELIKGYRDNLINESLYIEKNLKVVLSGIAVANKKGRDFIPHADLALQITQERGEYILSKFNRLELDKELALKFLAKENIILDSAVERGYLLLLYKGQGLGFVKNLGNRCNSLLPNSRRVRMSIG